ncbi:hypothetical protein D3C75_1384780 [compost metagenome]
MFKDHYHSVIAAREILKQGVQIGVGRIIGELLHDGCGLIEIILADPLGTG